MDKLLLWAREIFDLPKLQATVAPLTAPVPSAISIAAEAYKYVTLTASPFWGGLAATAAFLGIETVGGASCYALVKLHRQKSYGIEFCVSLLGIAVYIGSGLWTLYGSPMIIFFFLAPFAYFSYSIIRSMEKEIAEKVSETEAQTQLINAETRRTNAEIRKAKAVHSVRLDVGQVSNLSKEYRTDVGHLLDSQPNLSAREIARKLNISPTTASEHKKMWLDRSGQ